MQSPALLSIAAIIVAYLVGSLSFAVIISRLFGLDDPRTYGSGNPGATNVLRSGNKGAAILTLVFDALKGWLPTWLAVQYATELAWPGLTVVLVGLAAFLGHLWPVFFRFVGGKGVATAAGVLFGLAPMLGVVTLAAWLIVAIAFRYSSLASIAAAVVAPPAYLWLIGGIWGTAGVAVMSVLLLLRHRANIQKLLAGTESKIGQKAKAS